MNEFMFIWTSSYLVIMGIHDTYISTYYLPEGKKRTARDAQINMLHCHEPKKLSINIKTSKVSGHKIRP